MNARLPPPTATADQLIAQWSSKLRKTAFECGVDLDDVRQTAWLLAAEMAAAGHEIEVGKWHNAVHTQVLLQRDGVHRFPDDDDGVYIGTGWLLSDPDGFDDPARAAEAAEIVAHRIGGAEGDAETRWQRISQEIDLPRTSWEIAAARRCSERHGRRQAAQLRVLRAMQPELFEGVEA